MYLVVNPRNGKKKTTHYAQLEYAGSSFSKPLEFTIIKPKKRKRKVFDSSKGEIIGSANDDQRYTPMVDNTIRTNEVVAMFSKFLEYCDLENEAKSVHSFVDFSQFEEVCIHSSISTEIIFQIKNLVDSWMQKSTALLLDPQQLTALLDKFAINLKLIFTYCWIIDTFPSRCHTVFGEGLTEVIKPWFLALVKNPLFIGTLQTRYNQLAASIFEDELCELNSIFDFLDTVDSLSYIVEKLKLVDLTMRLKLRLHGVVLNMEELATKVGNIQSIAKDQMSPSFTARRTNKEHCLCKLLCDIFDALFCSEEFYESIFNGRITTESFLEYFSIKRTEIEYESRRVEHEVLESIKKVILSVSLSANYSSANKVREFMVEVLQVQSSEILLDATSFTLYWEFVVHNIENNCNIALKEHFRSFADLMSRSTNQDLMKFIFDKTGEFLHERIILFVDSELHSAKKLLAFAHDLSEFFSFEQNFALQGYERGMKELLETSHVRSFVEIKTLHHEGFRDLQLLKSKKVNIPQNVGQNIREILRGIRPENKKMRLNTSYNTVKIDVNYGSRTCQLTCSAFVAVILLQFEEVDELSYEELKQKTGINDSLLKSSIGLIEGAGLVHESRGLIKFITNPGSLGPSLLIK